MRALFTCVPQAGHITPLLPLAEAFAQQGDEVRFVTGADAEESITARGLGFSPAGPRFDEWFDRLRSRTRGLPGDGLAPEHIERYFLPRLFGEIGTAVMLDDLLQTARDWRPDLLIFEPYVYAAPIVAAVAEISAVLHTIGVLPDPVVVDLVADAVSPIWREFGRDVPRGAGMYDGASVSICPPSLDPASADLPNAHQLRPTALPRTSDRPSVVPPKLWERPVIYLTLGTFSNTNVELFRIMVEAVAELAVSAIVTVGGDNDPSVLGSVPANVHVAQFIPQTELLPHCAAVVHHAGAGTAFGIVAHGLPSVAIPQSADNFVIADRLAAANAAQVLMPGQVTVTSLRDAVGVVTTDVTYREAAQRIAAEMASMAAPEEVARTLRAM